MSLLHIIYENINKTRVSHNKRLELTSKIFVTIPKLYKIKTMFLHPNCTVLLIKQSDPIQILSKLVCPYSFILQWLVQTPLSISQSK